jgi:hypothetical protein
VMITSLSNQSIASLLFFMPASKGKSQPHSGVIQCRLPTHLHERQRMVDALIKVARDRELFIVELLGRGRPSVLVALQAASKTFPLSGSF